MIFRNLTPAGDWTFGAGKSNYKSGDEAIGLNVKTRLLSWVGDCFFDQLAGIDWKNRLGTKNQRSLLEIDLRRVILQSYGVTGIISISTDLNPINRIFNAKYNIVTVNSPSYIDSLTIGV